MRWDADGWLRTLDGGSLPTLETPAPDLLAHPGHPFPETPARNDFDSPHPDIDFQRLRTPHPEEIFSLTARPGFLRVTGCDTFGSFFTQALVTRRPFPNLSPASSFPPAWSAPARCGRAYHAQGCLRASLQKSASQRLGDLRHHGPVPRRNEKPRFAHPRHGT